MFTASFRVASSSVPVTLKEVTRKEAMNIRNKANREQKQQETTTTKTNKKRNGQEAGN
jgi:hypothetical protein